MKKNDPKSIVSDLTKIHGELACFAAMGNDFSALSDDISARQSYNFYRHISMAAECLRLALHNRGEHN